MKVIADLHIHSRFSRCCSKNITIPELAKWAEIKGIDILATSDFTHPQWLAEIKENLKDNGQGLFVFKKGEYKTHFILSTEVACIYKRGDQCRRLHLCILFPSIIAVEKFNKKLESLDKNLKSDGRPILGLDVREVVDIALQANERALIIPAHIWTPWFAMFGSKSGFNTAEECFGEYTKHIYAVETGLSSDPLMNWMVSDLDKFLLVSNSDAHSPENLGREANAWELEDFSYDEIYNIFKNKDKKKFLYTIEFYPEEGKYHHDGHLKCGISLTPEESKKNKGICPVCKKPLIIGTMNRVMELADRSIEEVEKIREQFVPYKSLIPLKEIIGEIENVGSKSKKVDHIYHKLIKKGENEFNLLLNIDIENLKIIGGEVFAEAIQRMRDAKVNLQPGYDGKYGVIKVFKENELKKIRGKQKSLF
jgi:DNA helicase II / ATP-dependent DNA helicase PcrA